jgi:hypothetical protein
LHAGRARRSQRRQTLVRRPADRVAPREVLEEPEPRDQVRVRLVWSRAILRAKRLNRVAELGRHAARDGIARADDVAGEEREALADRAPRALAVVAAVKGRNLPALDRVGIASRRLGAATDDGFRGADVLAMEAVINVDTVSDGTARRERSVMGRGHENLRRLGDPGPRGRCVLARALAAAQEVLDEADAAFDFSRGGGAEPEMPMATAMSVTASARSVAAPHGSIATPGVAAIPTTS